MKKVLFLAGMILLSSVTTAEAQRRRYRMKQQNAVKINPASIFAKGSIDVLSYERALNKNSSINIGGGFQMRSSDISMGAVSNSNMKEKTKVFGASVGYRYYFNQVLSGWYGMADGTFMVGSTDIDYGNFGGKDLKIENKYKAYVFGARGGYQYVMKSGFLVDLNVGIGYMMFNYDSEDKSDKNNGQGGAFNGALNNSVQANGIYPAASVAVGYAF